MEELPNATFLTSTPAQSRAAAALPLGREEASLHDVGATVAQHDVTTRGRRLGREDMVGDVVSNGDLQHAMRNAIAHEIKRLLNINVSPAPRVHSQECKEKDEGSTQP